MPLPISQAGRVSAALYLPDSRQAIQKGRSRQSDWIGPSPLGTLAFEGGRQARRNGVHLGLASLVSAIRLGVRMMWRMPKLASASRVRPL